MIIIVIATIPGVGDLSEELSHFPNHKIADTFEPPRS